jgi:translation initiation factor IF-2
MDLRAPVLSPAEGTVLEARISKGLGVVTTCIVQRGVLRVGDFLVAGASWGKVRSLLDDSGQPVAEALPSAPVQVRLFVCRMALLAILTAPVMG